MLKKCKNQQAKKYWTQLGSDCLWGVCCHSAGSPFSLTKTALTDASLH